MTLVTALGGVLVTELPLFSVVPGVVTFLVGFSMVAAVAATLL